MRVNTKKELRTTCLDCSFCQAQAQGDGHFNRSFRKPLGDEGFHVPFLKAHVRHYARREGSPSRHGRKLLGHKDIRMALDIYNHAADDMEDAAIGAISEAFS
jgi:integrase